MKLNKLKTYSSLENECLYKLPFYVNFKKLRNIYLREILSMLECHCAISSAHNSIDKGK